MLFIGDYLFFLFKVVNIGIGGSVFRFLFLKYDISRRTMIVVSSYNMGSVLFYFFLLVDYVNVVFFYIWYMGKVLINFRVVYNN